MFKRLRASDGVGTLDGSITVTCDLGVTGDLTVSGDTTVGSATIQTLTATNATVQTLVATGTTSQTLSVTGSSTMAGVTATTLETSGKTTHKGDMVVRNSGDTADVISVSASTGKLIMNGQTTGQALVEVDTVGEKITFKNNDGDSLMVIDGGSDTSSVIQMLRDGSTSNMIEFNSTSDLGGTSHLKLQKADFIMMKTSTQKCLEINSSSPVITAYADFKVKNKNNTTTLFDIDGDGTTGLITCYNLIETRAGIDCKDALDARKGVNFYSGGVSGNYVKSECSSTTIQSFNTSPTTKINFDMAEANFTGCLAVYRPSGGSWAEINAATSPAVTFGTQAAPNDTKLEVTVTTTAPSTVWDSQSLRLIVYGFSGSAWD